MVQAVIIPGDKDKEGTLIDSVAYPWFEIIPLMQGDPEIMYQIDPRKWEEIIAGAYTSKKVLKSF